MPDQDKPKYYKPDFLFVEGFGHMGRSFSLFCQ